MLPWNTDALKGCCDFDVIATDGDVRSILYEGEPYHGEPTQVFAYLGVPRVAGPVPGMVCAHGGGGKAFKEWVEMWSARGYAAVAMDFSGRGPDGERLPNGGPEQGQEEKFGLDGGPENIWTYHAIAALIRGHSILRSCDGDDAGRTALTGISWGGYLTCIAAGVDDRFAFAVPVYGCGFLQENSAQAWLDIFEKMTDEERRTWHDGCDPSVYVGNARMPMLFITGTNDNAYPMDSLKKTCALPQGDVTMCVRLEMAHGHQAGWEPREIDMFADHFFRGAPALPAVSRMRRDGNRVCATVVSDRPIAKGHLLYTADAGRWQERKWHQIPADLEDRSVAATLPDPATVSFLAVEDDRGAYVSSPHETSDDPSW